MSLDLFDHFNINQRAFLRLFSLKRFIIVVIFLFIMMSTYFIIVLVVQELSQHILDVAKALC